MAKGKGGNKHDLHKGMTRKNPPGIDSSYGCSGPSVNSEATRSKPGHGHSLGPREA